MREYFFAAAAAATLLASEVNGQVSGPNRTGLGTSPGTFQQPSDLKPPTPSDPINPTPRAGVLPPQTSPAPGSTTITPPRTGIDTPDARAGRLDPYASPTIRRDGSINDSRDWERGGPASGELGEDRERLTPPPDISPRPRPLGGTLSTGTTSEISEIDPDRSSLSGGPQAPKVGSDLNTTGVNTPPRAPEQPLDQALSAKIRAQLSTVPAEGKPMVRIAPETVRDLRITSQSGKVVLEGNVGSEKEKEMIEFRAKEVQGVARIENRLKVRAQGAPGAAESGKSGSTNSTSSGQSPQNANDLKNEHKELTPDR